jgi:hypothetical protein
MAATFLLLSAFLLYVTLSGRGMSYELGAQELKIGFGLSGIRIPYAAIADAQLCSVSLLLRIFGGSWPGLYWGRFQAEGLGRIRVYSTRPKGNLILISLVNGDRIAISPEKPEQFLESLRPMGDSFGRMQSSDLEGYELPRRALYLQVLIISTLYLAFLGYILWKYPSLPEVIPVHYGPDWKPDRWGHKSELLLLAGVAAVFPAIDAIFVLKFGRYDRSLTIFLGLLLSMVLFVFLGIAVGMLSSI